MSRELEKPQEKLPDANMAKTRRGESPGAGERGPAKVLLVDDDPGILQLLQLHLEAVPYAVTCRRCA